MTLPVILGCLFAIGVFIYGLNSIINDNLAMTKKKWELKSKIADLEHKLRIKEIDLNHLKRMNDISTEHAKRMADISAKSSAFANDMFSEAIKDLLGSLQTKSRSHQLDQTTMGLIRLAAGSSNENEARNAAMQACKRINKNMGN